MAIRPLIVGFMSACVWVATADTSWADTASPRGGAVSTALCADAYLLALAEPETITALSWQSRQSVSAAPDWARLLPQASASAEVLLMLDPELVVFGPGDGARTQALLERTGYQTASLLWGEDFDTVRENYRLLGEALDRPEVARRQIAALDQRLQALADRAENRQRAPRIAYLSSSGGSAGAGTFVDAAIRAAGGINVIAEGGAAGWTRSDPEYALTLEADILLTSFFVDGFEGRFDRARHHAAYARLLEAPHRMDIPSGDWPCAGPRLINAAERIADAIDAWSEEP